MIRSLAYGHSSAFNAIAILLIAHCSKSALASPLFQHTGSNDPVSSEGWSQSGVGMSVTAGPINDGGTQAWFVDDNGILRDSTLAYSAAPTATQITLGSTFGWSLIAKLRVIDFGDTEAKGSPFLAYYDGTRGYILNFGTLLNGDPIAHLPSTFLDTLPGTDFIYSGGGNGYHLYEITYQPQSSTIDLFVDGIKRVSGYPGLAVQTTPRVVWGAGTSNDTGQGNFNLVEFSVVPEPATAALLWFFPFAMVVCRRR